MTSTRLAQPVKTDDGEFSPRTFKAVQTYSNGTVVRWSTSSGRTPWRSSRSPSERSG